MGCAASKAPDATAVPPSLGSPGAVGAQSQADSQQHADAAQDLDEQPAEVVSHEKEADGAPAADTAEALTPAKDVEDDVNDDEKAVDEAESRAHDAEERAMLLDADIVKLKMQSKLLRDSLNEVTEASESWKAK